MFKDWCFILLTAVTTNHCTNDRFVQSFCTIGSTTDYWFAWKNLVLLICIYSCSTSCILCGFDLNRLDRWNAVGSKNYYCGYSFTKTRSREVTTGSQRLVFRCSFSFPKINTIPYIDFFAYITVKYFFIPLLIFDPPVNASFTENDPPKQSRFWKGSPSKMPPPPPSQLINFFNKKDALLALL